MPVPAPPPPKKCSGCFQNKDLPPGWVCDVCGRKKPARRRRSEAIQPRRIQSWWRPERTIEDVDVSGGETPVVPAVELNQSTTTAEDAHAEELQRRLGLPASRALSSRSVFSSLYNSMFGGYEMEEY